MWFCKIDSKDIKTFMRYLPKSTLQGNDNIIVMQKLTQSFV